MHAWIESYLARQRELYAALPTAEIASLVALLQTAHKNNRTIYVFGNGGSAANASHFAVDLGKGASDKLGKPFRVVSLNDNTPWLTALGNDYAYEDVFVRQLQTYGQPGDIAMTTSVSGSSPNCVKALSWANENGLETVAIVGGKRGRLADVAKHALVLPDTHYGRVEDAQMTIYHLLCYAFMEGAAS